MMGTSGGHVDVSDCYQRIWDVSYCQHRGGGTWVDGSRTVAGGCRKRLRLFTQGEDSTRHSRADRRSSGADRAHLLPAPRRQARRALRWICPPPRANRGRGGRGAPGGRPARRCCLGLAAAITMLGEFRRDLSRQRHAVIAANPELGSRSWRNWPTQPLSPSSDG